MSKLMNRNFRVKFGRNLVGYAGLCAAIGVERANHLITKMMRSSLYKKVFVVKGVKVSFYSK